MVRGGVRQNVLGMLERNDNLLNKTCSVKIPLVNS